MREWHLVPAMNVGHIISILLFLGVLALGLLKPRFWCKYVCPSGAVFSVANLFRVSERKVESSCINCNKCVQICPFDAIKPDFTTRITDCTLCQTCGGVCPTQSIKFVERWNVMDLKAVNDPPTVTLARPTAGAQFLAPAMIELEAEASDVDGAIRKVEFYAGATLLGEASVAPFRLSWTDVVAGSHTLSAKATDNAGSETRSGELTVTVLASLRSAEVLADGSFRFRLAGEPGRPYVIEMSEDLARWTPWQTNTVATTGWMVVTEPVAEAFGHRYYRARLEP